MRVDGDGFSHRGVEVSAESVRIPTYVEGPADRNPPLFGKGVRTVYPYTWQSAFTSQVEDREYDAIVLKSRHLKVTILPDWGMHIHQAIDLQTGRNMFQCSKVMKPANNAIRGAYVAGGVEMNFPIGHNTMTWSRVGLHLKKTDEGVQALFHHVDKRSGLEVAAGVTLRPDFRGLLFDQIFHNPTPLPRPWYYWLNAGIAPDPSLRFLFPTDEMLGHFEGPFLETVSKYAYPIHGGKDYARNADIPEPIGLFSPGGLEGWFGAWYDAWNFGIVRWAPPWQVSGQKFWSWGTSEEGMIWGKIAADQELPIPEIQSGRPETQMDRGILRPYATTRHREWWMPVSGIQDVQTASEYGAMSLDRNGPTVRISPAAAISNCRLEVNRQLLPSTFELKPSVTHDIRMSIPIEQIRSLRIVGAEGTCMAWSDERKITATTSETLYSNPRPVEELSAEALFLRGFAFERTLRPDLARRWYRLALEKDPDFSKAHLHLGLLDLLTDRIPEAILEFRKALTADHWNDEALYLHGLALLWSDNRRQGVADLCKAAATGHDYVVPALVQLSLGALKDQEHARHRMLLEQGLQIEANNPTLLFAKAVVCRKTGDAAGWRQACQALEQALGFSLMSRWEHQLYGQPDETRHIAGLPETDDSLAIAAALQYVTVGARQDAIQVLTAARSPAGATEAGYLLRWLGEEPSNAPGASFFAWGRETKAALESSLKTHPDDAIANFALGCQWAELGQTDKALSRLELAAGLAPADPIIRTTWGLVCTERGLHDEAVRHFQVAIALTPPNPRAWIELDRALKRIGKRDECWRKQFLSAPGEVLAHEEARESLAALCADLGAYDDAERLLASIQFHPYELTHHLRNLLCRIHRERAVILARKGSFREACGEIDKALEYPFHLQMGKPLRGYDAETLYVAGCIHEAAGDPKGATSYFAQAAGEYQPDPTLTKPWSILAQIKMGQHEAARENLAGLLADATRYHKAQFMPDISEDLEAIIGLCRRIAEGWLPSLEDMNYGTAH